MSNNIFKQQISKLKSEAILKSALCGGAIGLSVGFISALITWFTEFRGFWLSLAVLVVVSAAVGALFYYKRFYPTVLKNAKRIDAMGLEERLITMVEFENDTSFMASIQRADAMKALANVTKEHIKFEISKAIVVTSIICSTLSGGMLTVNALSEYDVLPRGDELFATIADEVIKASYKVTYEAGEGGVIVGEAEQLIEDGESGTAVVAVANDGYYFVKWNDGLTNPARVDRNVIEHADYVAEFAPIDDEEWMDDGTGDDADDAPKENGGGQPSSGESDGEPSDSEFGGGMYEPNNQIINGSTYYRQDMESYKDEANDRILDENSDLTEEEIELIKKYLGIV